MRLFIAILFDDDTIARLMDIQDELKHAGIEGRFMPRENLHMTLSFIGEYGDPHDVMDVLDEVKFKSFNISMDRIYSFRDMYMTSFEESGELSAYVKRLRHALAQENIPYDRKKFIPHVTLVRKATLKAEHPIIPEIKKPIQVSVAGISLMRSEFGKNGMIYTELGFFKER